MKYVEAFLVQRSETRQNLMILFVRHQQHPPFSRGSLMIRNRNRIFCHLHWHMWRWFNRQAGQALTCGHTLWKNNECSRFPITVKGWEKSHILWEKKTKNRFIHKNLAFLIHSLISIQSSPQWDSQSNWFFLFLIFLCMFLGLHPWHMEIPRLRAESEL